MCALPGGVALLLVLVAGCAGEETPPPDPGGEAATRTSARVLANLPTYPGAHLLTTDGTRLYWTANTAVTTPDGPDRVMEIVSVTAATGGSSQSLFNVPLHDSNNRAETGDALAASGGTVFLAASHAFRAVASDWAVNILRTAVDESNPSASSSAGQWSYSQTDAVFIPYMAVLDDWLYFVANDQVAHVSIWRVRTGSSPGDAVRLADGIEVGHGVSSFRYGMPLFAVNDRGIFWAHRPDDAGPPRFELHTIPLDGSAPDRTVFSAEQLDGAIATDGRAVYWAADGLRVADLTVAQPTARVLASDASPDNDNLILDASRVFWLELHRNPAATDNRDYYRVMSARRDGSAAPQVVAADQPDATRLVQDSTNLYWVVSGPSPTARIMTARKS